MPPSISAAILDSYVYTIVGLLDSVKTRYDDAAVFIGGDINGKDIGRVLNAFPELKPVNAGAIRRGLALDEIYTNLS